MSARALPPWQPASDATWDDRWFLCHGKTADQMPFRDRYHFDAGGDLIWYASQDTAARAARRMNEREACEYVRAKLRQHQPGFAAALEAVTDELTGVRP